MKRTLDLSLGSLHKSYRTLSLHSSINRIQWLHDLPEAKTCGLRKTLRKEAPKEAPHDGGLELLSQGQV